MTHHHTNDRHTACIIFYNKGMESLEVTFFIPNCTHTHKIAPTFPNLLENPYVPLFGHTLVQAYSFFDERMAVICCVSVRLRLPRFSGVSKGSVKANVLPTPSSETAVKSLPCC